MPYIEQEQRTAIDKHIDCLANSIVENSHGEHDMDGILNYAISSLVLRVLTIRYRRIRYWMVAMVCGVLHNVATEFYRRTAVPYEDKKKNITGDLKEYDDLLEK